jgi:hypothetical protein
MTAKKAIVCCISKVTESVAVPRFFPTFLSRTHTSW